MYYVMQVAPGKEAETELFIMKKISQDVFSSCFHLVRHEKKKFRGEWQDRCEKLLPGYVFINSENVEELYLALKNVPMLTKLLGFGRDAITALTDQEAEWLETLILVDQNGKINGEVPLSRIELDEEDEIRFLSGPLQAMEGRIKRIHLHRRIAEVEVNFMGRKTLIHLGIDLVERK